MTKQLNLEIIKRAIEQPEQHFSENYHVHFDISKSFVKRIPVKIGEKVLDVGCRCGKVSELIAKTFPQSEVTALTSSQNFLDVILQDQSIQATQNLNCHYKDFITEPFLNTFDKVVSFNHINWVKNKGDVIQAMHKSLKPGGEAHIKMFVDHGHEWFVQCGFDVAHREKWKSKVGDKFEKINHLTPGQFMQLAEQSGFIVKNCAVAEHQIQIKDEQAFKNFMFTWPTLLKHLSAEEIDELYSEMVEEYLINNPKNAKGEIYYKDYFMEACLIKKQKL